MLKRRSWFLTALLAGICLLSRPSSAQTAAPRGGPVEVARASLQDLKDDRIESFAKAMHPESLAQLRTALLGILDEATRAGKSQDVLVLFDGVKNANELKALDPVAFMASYLRGSTKQMPGYREILNKLDMQIVGPVAEGKDKVYVVYRSKRFDDSKNPGMLKVVGLRQHGDGWRMLLDDDLQVILFALKQRVVGADSIPKFDLAASQVELLGHVAEGAGTVHEVFRLTTPTKETSFSKVSVLTVSQTDPEWAIVQRGKRDEITRLIEQSMGIKPITPAANQAPPSTPRP